MSLRGSAIVLGVFAVLAGLVPAAAADDLAAGRRIFRRGVADGEMVASFGRAGVALPAAVRRCAGCHGPDGAGGQEGGVAIPGIAAPDLAAPRQASPGRPGRASYDKDTLARVLADGVDPAGRALGAGMPRFRLTPGQFAALNDYLAVLGTDRDVDPGVAADAISIGAILPLSGPRAAWGGAMRAGLETALAQAGAIYGRRLHLVAVDAGDDVAQSLRRLTAGDEVFALVASLVPPRAEAVGDAEDVPIIGPLAPTPARPESNRFYLLAPIEDQMRVLVDEIAAEHPAPVRLAVIGPAGSAADAVTGQASRTGMTVMRCTTIDELTVIEPLPDMIVALPGTDLAGLLARLPARFAAATIAAPAETLSLDETSDARLRLVLPVLPANTRDHEVSAGPPPLAVAAAAVLIEGVKRMGAHASRAGLIAALESLSGFPTGVLPALSFARGQHAGNHASVVVRSGKGRDLIVLGDWRSPQ